MLNLKDSQLQKISLLQLAEFRVRLKKHLELFFPEIMAKLKENESNAFLEEGIYKALKYKLETEYQITVYFNLMLTLGLDFECDENYPWAKRLLDALEIPAEERVEKLTTFAEAELA